MPAHTVRFVDGAVTTRLFSRADETTRCARAMLTRDTSFTSRFHRSRAWPASVPLGFPSLCLRLVFRPTTTTMRQGTRIFPTYRGLPTVLARSIDYQFRCAPNIRDVISEIAQVQRNCRSDRTDGGMKSERSSFRTGNIPGRAQFRVTRKFKDIRHDVRLMFWTRAGSSTAICSSVRLLRR